MILLHRIHLPIPEFYILEVSSFSLTNISRLEFLEQTMALEKNRCQGLPSLSVFSIWAVLGAAIFWLPCNFCFKSYYTVPDPFTLFSFLSFLCISRGCLSYCSFLISRMVMR
ncbi:hypothetical protein CI102_8936 [Trichoderma harzianum]|nr:hypothetical protein CI102_8936 [Trichoderma harzianum]